MKRLHLPKNKSGRLALCAVAALCLVGIVSVIVINAIVVCATDERILSLDEAASLTQIDYLLVLGTGLEADGTPADRLHDRVLTAVRLHEAGLDATLLMSGDNQHPDYDEISAMVTLALQMGENEADIEMDRLGLSTRESVARARELYGAKRIVIVTQQYHLYRSLYIAEQLGLDAYGVPADLRNSYRGMAYRQVREVAARCKDFVLTLFD
ncbi:MAG: YdcF family protein [Clostridia bacterium]|nr:YdcF family protein [Clostridia bacterium]